MPKQDQTRVISAKDLGALALESFCPRCFWFERHFGKSPSIFPGIFSTLDSLTKRSTQRSFSERGNAPDWLPLDNLKQPTKVPRISKPVPEYGGWILSGSPDDIFEMIDGSHHIVDYKTAKFTATQDSLLPMYEVQLNAYAFGLPHHGIKPISRLSLIYCQPGEDLDSDENFKLTFSTHVLDIKINLDIIPRLLLRARQILDEPEPPECTFGCKGICSWVLKLNAKTNTK